MAEPLLISRCKAHLSRVWTVGVLITIALLAYQSVFLDYYGDSTGDVWKWYMGAVSPTIGLIVAVRLTDQRTTARTDKEADPDLFRWARWLSIVYLLSLLGIVMVSAWRAPLGGLPELARGNGAWLTSLQGLITGVLAGFYVKK